MTHRYWPPMPRPFPATTVYITAGTPRTRWCTACKAHTGFTGTVLLLTPDGVSTVGAYTGCEICDDEPDEGSSTHGR